MGIRNLEVLWQSACTAIVDGERCGRESCAPVHMVNEEAGGHDYQE